MNPKTIKDIKFTPLQSVIDQSFWHKLSEMKLDIDRLEENERDIWGLYMNSNVCSLYVSSDSFNSVISDKLYSSRFTSLDYLCKPDSTLSFPLLSMKGTYKNFNSLESFKGCDKTALLTQHSNTLKQSILSGGALDDSSLLLRFFLITYADLKNHEFYYWFAFPTSFSFDAHICSERKLLCNVFTDDQLKNLMSAHSSLEACVWSVFGISLGSDDSVSCFNLRNLIERINKGDEDVYLCFLDPSLDPEHPGWPLRNFLSLVSYHVSGLKEVILKVISLRLGQHFKNSSIFSVSIKETDPDLNKWIGWERNERGKLGPRMVSLKESMDPVRLAASSAELNLKLMKWRLLPTLNLEIISRQSCLILGAGTLGCSLARMLLAWGVRKITLVDSGKVSYSNPVRQSLYMVDDVYKDKASTAALALQEILPSVDTKGISLEVPMPGHPVTANTQESCSKLASLIDESDCSFLVTDSRESRWLPALLSASSKKLCMTVALGFDSYLVMRHGIPGQENRLGCYFCNDITAPGNSKLDRTLDQQCTVTRPGVSSIAAALAAELYVSLLQHPKRGEAGSKEDTSLGDIPHSIRGFLSSYSQVLPSTPAFSNCIACSPIVVDKYKNETWDFLSKVFNSANYLEEITGLKELQEQTDDIEQWGLSDEESSQIDETT